MAENEKPKRTSSSGLADIINKAVNFFHPAAKAGRDMEAGLKGKRVRTMGDALREARKRRKKK